MPPMSDVVAFIASQPGGPARLLAVHVPDDAGRCCGCTLPGYGTPDEAWPCAMHYYASAAADVAGRRRDDLPAAAPGTPHERRH